MTVLADPLYYTLEQFEGKAINRVCVQDKADRLAMVLEQCADQARAVSDAIGAGNYKQADSLARMLRIAIGFCGTEAENLGDITEAVKESNE